MPKIKKPEKDLINPDSINDENTKKYGTEGDPDLKEAMDSLLGEDSSDDKKVQLDEVEKRMKVQEESKIPVKKEDKKEEENIQEVVSETVDEIDKPEKESVESIKAEESAKVDKPKEQEEDVKPEFKLSESAEKALKPYEGDFSHKLDQLVKANNELNAHIAKLQNVQNTLQDLGWQELKQHEVAGNMKELKVAAEIISNPFYFELAEGILTGNIPKELQVEEKLPQDFMPPEESFDYNEAMSDRRSYSHEAHSKWEAHKRNTNQQIDSLLSKAREGKNNVSDLHTKVEAGKKKLQEVEGRLKVRAKDEYAITDTKFDEIMGKLRNFDEDLLMVAFAVEARRHDIKSKVVKKIEENKNKVAAESLVEESVESESDVWSVDEKMEKEGAEFFADWEKSDDRVY